MRRRGPHEFEIVVVDLVERNANWGGCCRRSRADGV
jgi:hypothetical protein